MIRGSEIFATRLCTGRPKAQDGLAEQTSEEALEGTLIHDAHHNPDKAAALTGDQLLVLESQIRAREELTAKIFSGVDIASLRVMREEDFYITNSKGESIISGHPDFVAIGDIGGKSVALIIDYKAGWLSDDVPLPEVNDQLRAYAVMIGQLWSPDEIYVSIIPRFGKAMTPAVYDVHSATLAYQDMVAVEEASREHADIRTPSLAACKYCKAKATPRCPETQRLPAVFNQPLNIATLGPVEWANLLDVCSMAEDRTKAIRAKAKELLAANPEAIPGYGFKPGAKMPEVSDPQAVYAAVQHAITPEVFGAECCDVSVTKLRKVYGTALKIKVKDQKDELDKVLGPLITYTPKSPSLVRTAPALPASE